LAREVLRYAGNPELYSVPWYFTLFPGQPFKDAFGAALLQYAQGSMQWADVQQLFIDQWKAEKAKAAGG
jgi:raffinose/stachyose/melibiose transport system substrate-binding protein